MANAWHKTMVALGLADESEHDYEPRTAADSARPAAGRALERVTDSDDREAPVAPLRNRQIAPVSEPEVEMGLQRITTIHPRSYNDARSIGESFRDGIPVIMNLSDMDDADAKRMVDFSAGLVFGLNGVIEKVTSKVFLLSPEHIAVEGDVSGDDSAFYNQS